MRIAHLRVHSIAIADPPLRSSYGLHAPYALRTVLELESDDGVVGIAETYGGERPAQALRDVSDQVVAADPYRLTGALLPMVEGGPGGLERSQTHLVPGENPLDVSSRTYSALETACLDLIGKSVGQPVCELIGGRVRDDKYGEALSPEALVGQVRQMIDEYGFGSVKFKGGVLDPDVEIETIRQLRREFGTRVPLRIDPNAAWTVDTSVHVGQSLTEELSAGGYLEDPAMGIDGMAEVRKRLLAEEINTPLASNVAVTSFTHIPEAVEKEAVQVILCDHHYWGGMRQVQHLGKLCQVFGIGLSMHSNSHLGVSLMAMAHVAAATSHLSYACDTHYPWQSPDDEIVAGGRVPIVNGCVRIPDRPGLGVELDYDQLARGKERFEKTPYRKRDDEAEMRKHVDPEWQRVLPRW